MAEVYLSFGSNLGDRGAAIRAALAALPAAVRGSVEAISRLYETAPWGVTDQPPFLNGVARISTPLAPAALLAALKRLEAAAGRHAGPRWGPRPLDLDILLYDDLALATPTLTIPHPRLLERRFVLQPLADLWPPDRPLLGAPLADHLARVADQAVALSSEQANTATRKTQP
jgi:2-amino-4-hydroxy-6-hydroxymethyldihydropteridine diphosphokinase